jgi:predicted nucleotidyltransferase
MRKQHPEMLTKRSAMETVKRFAGEVKNSGVHLSKVILFGSYAFGKPHKWSDIDVVLVAEEFTGTGFDDVAYFARINNKKPYIRIEAKTFPPAHFKKGDPFIDEVKRTVMEIKI